jgi:hypothetical protein|eukprot:COSAG01_NODE_19702_length_994_cov_6.045746_2_plen_108_part_00
MGVLLHETGYDADSCVRICACLGLACLTCGGHAHGTDAEERHDCRWRRNWEQAVTFFERALEAPDVTADPEARSDTWYHLRVTTIMVRTLRLIPDWLGSTYVLRYRY